MFLLGWRASHRESVKRPNNSQNSSLHSGEAHANVESNFKGGVGGSKYTIKILTINNMKSTPCILRMHIHAIYLTFFTLYE